MIRISFKAKGKRPRLGLHILPPELTYSKGDEGVTANGGVFESKSISSLKRARFAIVMFYRSLSKRLLPD